MEQDRRDQGSFSQLRASQATITCLKIYNRQGARKERPLLGPLRFACRGRQDPQWTPGTWVYPYSLLSTTYSIWCISNTDRTHIFPSQSWFWSTEKGHNGLISSIHRMRRCDQIKVSVKIKQLEFQTYLQSLRLYKNHKSDPPLKPKLFRLVIIL